MTSAPLWAQVSDMAYMSENGRAEHPSHAFVLDRIGALYPESPFDLLDCGVLSGVTYRDLKNAGLSVNYTGIDISEPILSHCRELYPEARWAPMSVMDMAFANNSFDMVNCRHLLECLPYYETAVREIFRVARRHVAITLGLVPKEPEALHRRETADGYIWFNRYAPGPFELLLSSLSESVEIVDTTAGRRTDRTYFCTALPD